MDNRRKNLKSHRIAKGLTQEDLASHSGISIRTIQRIEKGFSAGSIYSVNALVKTLNIERNELIVVDSHLTSDDTQVISIIKLMCKSSNKSGPLSE